MVSSGVGSKAFDEKLGRRIPRTRMASHLSVMWRKNSRTQELKDALCDYMFDA